ncbi:MAG: hypothetical protein ACE37H_03535 [Phycisphaeraceae bacterium]
MDDPLIENTPDQLLSEIHGKLQEYEGLCGNGSLRDMTRKIVEIQTLLRELGRSVGISMGLSPSNARQRIKSYFTAYPGEVIDGDELGAISGISEYARRIRELRNSDFIIETGPEAVDPATGNPLRPDQYLYLPPEPKKPQLRT